MELDRIITTCPKCGEEFRLSAGLKTQALKKFKLDLKEYNKSEINKKILQEKKRALKEGEQKGYERYLDENKKIIDELDEKQIIINKMKLENISKESLIKNLKKKFSFSNEVELKKQTSLHESEIDDLKKKHALQINSLKLNLKKLSEKTNSDSNQIRGEAGELSIKEKLQDMFPEDEVLDIPNGQPGADCILVIRKKNKPIGKIVFESKKTKSFSSGWISKLKKDTFDVNGQLSVLVTKTFPKDINKAHLKEGVWICGFHEYEILVKVFRQSIVDLAMAEIIKEDMTNKSEIMFSFITSKEFINILEKMIKPIFEMQEQLRKEKLAIQSQWKKREILIESSIFGTNELYTQIKAIAEVNLPSINGYHNINDLIEKK